MGPPVWPHCLSVQRQELEFQNLTDVITRVIFCTVMSSPMVHSEVSSAAPCVFFARVQNSLLIYYSWTEYFLLYR
jgi:hypothetical protein